MVKFKYKVFSLVELEKLFGSLGNNRRGCYCSNVFSYERVNENIGFA